MMKVLLGKIGKEAVEVWQEYFEELLNGGEEGIEEVQGGMERFGSGGNGVLGGNITSEEEHGHFIS